jgi:dihydrodipicolinate synthase/N-acetylneuraminate lyase
LGPGAIDAKRPAFLPLMTSIPKLQGIFISVATPFNHKGEIWETKVEHNVEKWNRTTVAGYVLGGDPSLTPGENSRLLELVTKFAAPGKTVFAEAPEGLYGWDRGFAQALAGGATGVISTIANALPYTMISIWEAHRTRDFEAAADWQNRIAGAVELIERPNGIAALKYAMDLNGYYGGPPRLPLTVLTPDQKREVERAFEGIKG